MDEYSTVMDDAADIEQRLSARLRRLRSERGLTLDALADRSGVSRSMISLVERRESSPTAALLDKLAAGLGVSLASLFTEDESREAAPLALRAEQRVWRDPDTGYVRRNISPPQFPSAIELVEVVLPSRARVSFDSATRSPALDQQIWVIEGTLRVSVGEDTYDLAAGDCLAMRIDRYMAFHNPTGRAARYLVALAETAVRAAQASRL